MITKEEIKHLAQLARISVSEGEAEKMTSEIDSILEYVGQIKDISTENIEETPTLQNIMREDTVTHSPGEHTKAILSNAPSREGNYIKVKKIL
ncbi:MAG: Asp-tRNA(Asn)/Glu-tRNA(Gln) amidotransferase subunit GatC [Candidatus Zambryskibacteria bacterium]|nr:Asp-tRNA(Asn)/Glu-tRNA(Gln) amidotransferase subunit GatC [Candidatus Zambryskibacteria bacterium]